MKREILNTERGEPFREERLSECVEGHGMPDGTISLQCLRCQSAMSYRGIQEFHTGSKVSEYFLGVFGEGREGFDMYVCSECGHIELFAADIAAEQRPHNSEGAW